MATRDTVLARILIDDQTKLGFNSYARNVERAKKTSEAFRKHAIDKIQLGLETQVQALKKSAKELDLLAAANMGANQAQLDHITSLHQAIDAHKREAEAQEEAARQAKAKADEDQRAADITAKAIRQLQFEADTADKTADEIQILKLRMQGLNDEQIDSIRATQLATAELRGQGQAAAGTAKGGLRLMRGGLGQLGHQVQDVAVQLQMGQNALLVFGQQGSQVASLFGQNGALIGAFLAVGAAVGTALAPSLFKTKDAFEELKEIAEATEKILTIDFLTGTADLADEFEKLAKESKALADASIRMALLEAFKVATIAEEEFARVTKNLLPSLVAVSTTMGVAGDKVGNLSGSLGISTEEAKKLDAAHVAMIRGVEGSKEAFVELVRELAAGQPITSEMNEALVSSDKALQELSVEASRSEQRIATLTALLQGKKIATKDDAEATKEASDALKDANQKRQDFIRSLNEELNVIGLTNVELAVRRARLLGMSEQEVNLVRVKAEQIRVTNAYNNQIEIEKAQEEALITSKEDFVSGVVAQAEALGKSNIELLEANVLVGQLDSKQQTAFNNAIARMKEFKAEQDAAAERDQSISALQPILEGLMSEEELINESYIRRGEIVANAYEQGIIPSIQAYNDIMLGLERKQQEELDAIKKKEILRGSELTGHMLGQLGEQFAGVQAANKKMFAAQKAYKIANAIQNTYDAANNALSSNYPWPLPKVFAATAVAAGLANVAAIKSTSFDGGGFTGMGARSGGVDGKGGFPAILHPNETVIDHTKGQGGGITIVNNIDAKGADANVDMKIRAAMQQSSQQTVATIQDLMRRRRFV